MNYGLFFKISLIITVILTLCICFTKPQMHKNMLIYNSDYEVVEHKVETKKIQELPTVTTSTQKKTKDIEPLDKTEIKEKIQKPVQKAIKKPVKNNQKSEIKQVKKVEQPKKVQNIQKNTQSSEEIQWNIWRSNIQNQIMKETQLPMLPQGTVFKYSFDVDKYGKVSNVQTWSENPAYTPYAIQYMSPVIRSFQGRSLLDFPQGTNRTTTTATGGMKISSKVKYSTPKDFHDTEIVKR